MQDTEAAASPLSVPARAPVAKERGGRAVQSALRKPVNTLAIVPKSARITSLGRKAYNVLLFEAQEQGLERDAYRTPLERVMRGIDFDSHDHDLVKKHLRAMVSTTVEWQSPTTGEGATWNVSGLLAHAALKKERGQVWVEWSYAVNLKQELLEPTVFARLKLEVISQLRSHAAIALYEICMRYRDVGRTARQPWRWWRPVLSGQPESERTARLEYRIFKRDTLKPAIAEVNALTDLDIELVEHKQGRFISEIQFGIRPRKQAALTLGRAPDAVDLGLVARARELGVAEDKAEALLEEFGRDALAAGLETLARRIAHGFPEPVKDTYRYLRSVLPGVVPVAAAAPPPEPPKDTDLKRRSRWVEEWMRRRREHVVAQLRALSDAQQAALAAALLEDMARRNVHPSIQKRLQSSGWQHPLVMPEMIRYFATGSIGDHWNVPTDAELLAVAAELGDA